MSSGLGPDMEESDRYCPRRDWTSPSLPALIAVRTAWPNPSAVAGGSCCTATSPIFETTVAMKTKNEAMLKQSEEHKSKYNSSQQRS